MVKKALKSNASKKVAIIATFVVVVILFYAYKTIYEPNTVYVLITVDVERDLVPFFDSYSGVTEGIPMILEVLRKQNVKATFFVTGNVASRYPDIINQIFEGGHEIGGHGFMHEDFLTLDYDEKYEAINKTTALLKKFDVKTFRSPYQSADEEVMDILEELGYCAEASYEAGKETHTDTGRDIIRITSEPLFYPSSTYPASWIDIYERSLTQNRRKIIVVGLHSWGVLQMPQVEGAEEYTRASGDYTYTNLVDLIDYLKEQNVSGKNARFVSVKEICRLLLE